MKNFVCEVVPLNERTRHLIGRRELALMKPSAILVNIARGPATHETRRAMAERAIDNLERALLGGTPRDIVNPQVWARRQP